MNKIAIVFWSGSGNTEVMANCIAEGARAAGADVSLMGPGQFSAARLGDFGAVAFGCPAMGAEVLEEAEFDPMFTALEGALAGKKLALFGSYGWGDGQWMRDWAARCKSAQAVLLDEDGLMVNGAPDASAQDVCRELGKQLAAW